jgi:hypothetical protein
VAEVGGRHHPRRGHVEHFFVKVIGGLACGACGRGAADPIHKRPAGAPAKERTA